MSIEYKLTQGYKFSINDIRNYESDRTPHAGNLSETSNGMAVWANSRLLMYPSTAGDSTYRPRYVVLDEELEAVAQSSDPDTLTPFVALDEKTKNKLENRLGLTPLSSRSLAQLHIEIAQMVHTNAMPFHDIYDSDIGREVLKAVASVSGSCDRILMSNGKLATNPEARVTADELIKTTASLAKSSRPGEKPQAVPGPYLSNVANVVTHGLIRGFDKLQNGNGSAAQVMHISGPAMIDYTQKHAFQKEAERLIDEIATRLGLDKRALEIIVFPGSVYKIAVPQSDKAIETFKTIDEWTDFLLAYQKEGEERNDAIVKVANKHQADGYSDGNSIVTMAKRHIHALSTKLTEDLPEVPGMNFKPREYTQWQILQSGTIPPIIPESFYSLDAKQVDYLTDILEDIYEGNTKFNRTLPEDIFK